MDKEKFVKIMTYMCVAYNKELTKEQLDVWYSFLKDYTVDELNTAVKALINTEKHLPTIAHIKEQIAKNKTTSIPDAEDEWQEVLKLVSRYGSYRQQEALKSLKPYTAKIVQYVGYQNICMATPDEQVWNKKEFIADYNNLKNELIINLQLDNSNIKLLESKEDE